MSTYGKVSAWLTVLGLVGVFFLLAKLGNIHNAWSENMSKAAVEADKAEDAARRQKAELVKISNELARAQLGWDKSWNIANNANTGVVIQNDGRLGVAGLGQQNGLIPVTYQDGDETVTAAPAVHAFLTMPEAGMHYVGEFVADMQQNQIGPTDVTLIPNWQVTPQEVQMWASVPDANWRFRTLMPAAPRRKIDQLNAQIVRLNELYLETDANVAQQEQLLTQAEAQLKTRQNELLGADDREPIPGRPELNNGLLKTIKSEEDRRNELQVAVDRLRRDIKAESDRRDDILSRLSTLLQRLPSYDSDAYLSQGSDRSPN